MKFLLTLGTFDGVHLGHRRLLKRLKARAAGLGLKTMVVLFSAPPRFYFRPELSAPLLSSATERAALLRSLGIDHVRVLRFGARWAGMTRESFLEDFLLRRCRAGGMIVGPDFAFGRGRRGSVPWLARACRERGVHFEVLPFLRSAGRKVSSSGIRKLVLSGEMIRASRLLGRPYGVAGRVIRGRGLGSRLGFPTANLAVSAERLLPRGVFHVRVFGAGEEGGLGVCNVGTRPTLGGSRRVSAEIHLVGFKGTLYGRRIAVEFLRRLRPERKFPSMEALGRQVRRDILRVSEGNLPAARNGGRAGAPRR